MKRRARKSIRVIPAGTNRRMRSGQQFPNSQHFSNRPSLSDASSWRKGLFAIVDFGQRAQSVEIQCLELWFEQSSRSGFVLIDAEMGESELAKEPAPGCTLVIRSIAFAGPAGVVGCVTGFVRTEATQTYRSE